MTFALRTDWPLSENKLYQKLSQLLQTKQNIIDLTQSNPTQVSLTFNSQKLLNSLCNPESTEYNPEPHGLLKARESIMQYYEEKEISISPEQIFITASTSEAYSFLFKLLFNSGEKILCAQPSYPLLHYLTDLHDIERETYPLDEDSNWGLPWQALDYRNLFLIKGLLIVHPNNPTGHYTRKNDQNKLFELCQKITAPIIADEVFYDYALSDNLVPPSFANQNETLTFTISGISKILGLPQMKLSWIVVTGPTKQRKEAIRRLEVIADTFLSASTPIQLALPKWMEHRQVIQGEMMGRLHVNLDFAKKNLAEDFLSTPPPQGGWNIVLKIPKDITDEEFTLRLLEEEQTLVYPGYFFDFNKDHFIVLSLLTKGNCFQEGIQKIKAICTMA